jgi:hypothetical protein
LTQLILNVVFFQILWHACVGGGGYGYWWLGLPVLAVFCAYHFRVSRWKMADLQLLLIAVLLGGIGDSVLALGNIVKFQTALPFASLAPIWIVVLWAGFALTINHSMAWFKGKFWAAVAFGFFGGPLAYYGAARVYKSVVITADPMLAYGVLALLWAIMTPLLLQIGSLLIKRNEAPAVAAATRS